MLSIHPEGDVVVGEDREAEVVVLPVVGEVGGYGGAPDGDEVRYGFWSLTLSSSDVEGAGGAAEKRGKGGEERDEAEF